MDDELINYVHGGVFYPHNIIKDIISLYDYTKKKTLFMTKSWINDDPKKQHDTTKVSRKHA